MAGKTYYLVDLENVGLEGIHVKEKLPEEDTIHIFSTVNGPKIDITTLARLDRSSLAFHEVPPGKQSLDMHLVSALGLIMRGHPQASFVIISKDKDYDDVLAYWNAGGMAVSRREMIQNCGIGDRTTQSRKSDSRAPDEKREKAVREFVDLNFKGKKYQNCKDDIVRAVLESKTRSQVNNKLMKIIPGSEMKTVYGRIKALIADLPGQ